MKMLMVTFLLLHAIQALPTKDPFSECGRRADTTKIIGGNGSLPGDHPWQVSLQRRKKGSSEPFTHTCGGVLIKSCWVLTAAHCIKSCQDMQVVLGGVDIKRNEDSDQVIPVARAIIHPDYRPSMYPNDIALLELTVTNDPLCAVETRYVKTACLPNQLFPEGKECVISGWGRTENDKPSDRLLRAKVPLISTQNCSAAYPDQLDLTMMCAGYMEGGVDACRGDSGGPLMCKQDGIHYVAGLVGWGSRCFDSDKPGVYTNVYKFVDWIDKDHDYDYEFALTNCHLASFLSSDHYDSNFNTTCLKESYILGSTVRVPCNVGYVGSFKLLCVNDEGVKWIPVGSKCEPKSCGHPGDAEFAEFQLVEGEDYVFGSTVEYTCQTGYQMVSRTNRRRCTASGWDGFLPVCEAKQCPAIHVNETDMQVTGERLNASYGHVLRFRCKQNHLELDGPKQIYCDENGMWSALPPTCKVKSCGHPGNVTLAEVRLTKGEDFVLDSEVQYTCQTGYQVGSGSSKRRCTLNGWDGAAPVCQPCSSKLGIDYRVTGLRRVLDDQLTASSVYSGYNTSYPAYNARLGSANSWFPAENNQRQWLQVDLNHPRTITGIITQGGVTTSYYVKFFKLSHSNDGRSWTAIKDDSGSEIFTGNHNYWTNKLNTFESPITSRYVRVHPWTWNNGITLRIELLGCDD